MKRKTLSFLDRPDRTGNRTFIVELGLGRVFIDKLGSAVCTIAPNDSPFLKLPSGVDRNVYSAAECLVSPAGKWVYVLSQVYVSSHSHKSIVVGKIYQENGKLDFIER